MRTPRNILDVPSWRGCVSVTYHFSIRSTTALQVCIVRGASRMTKITSSNNNCKWMRSARALPSPYGLFDLLNVSNEELVVV